MTDILIQALMFAIVGPIIGCIVVFVAYVIAQCLFEVNETAGGLTMFIGFIMAAFIALAGITKGVFLFVRAVL